MNFGIDKISFYAPHYYIDLDALASARSMEAAGQMAITPPNEDIVTLAANATDYLLQDEDVSNIEMIMFATETGVDLSKSAASYIHKFFNLPKRCRVIELKQACYAATFGLQMAMSWLHQNPKKKVLLIAADIAKYEFNTVAELSQGSGAAAMLLSANPRVLEIEPECGFCTKEVMDFWRPNYSDIAFVNGRLSCDTYLRFAQETWQQYQELSGRKFTDHDRFCYHAPVPELVLRAHKKLAKLNNITNLSEEDIDYQIGQSLIYSAQVGNCYTASLYLGILSLLENAAEDLAGKLIGLYSYGSGSSGEFFAARVITDYRNTLSGTHHKSMLTLRQEISVAEYEDFYRYKAEQITGFTSGKFYLKEFDNHQRIYGKLE